MNIIYPAGWMNVLFGLSTKSAYVGREFHGVFGLYRLIFMGVIGLVYLHVTLNQELIWWTVILQYSNFYHDYHTNLYI